MRLFVPFDPGHEADLAAMTAAAEAAGAVAQALPYSAPSLSARMRFLHHAPAGPLPGLTELPAGPALPELVSLWSQALEGVLWADAGQIDRLAAQREWTRGPAGVEVTL